MKEIVVINGEAKIWIGLSVALPSSVMEKKNVGIWIRVSTEDQAKGESPEIHLKRAQAYAELKGWHVLEVYRLDGVSGKSVMSASETKRMIADVSNGRITALIFSKLARLARNTKELLDFSDLFRAYNADLISLKESIDTSTPAGRLYYTIIGAMATWEREEIAERVADAIPIRAREGKSLGGQAPFGYQWVDKKLVINEEEAIVRKLMFDLFVEHKRKRTVAKLLNERGYRMRGGHPFSDTTVRRLLTDPIVMGSRRVNYTKSTGNGQKWQLKPESDWVLRETPPLISIETWNVAKSILESQRAKNRKPTKVNVHLFTGVLRCRCGSRMYLLSNTPKYVCAVCRRKVHKDALETIFHEQLRAYVFDEAALDRHLNEDNLRIDQLRKSHQQLVRKEKELDKKLTDLLDLLQAKQIHKEGFARYHDPLFEQLNQVRNGSNQALADIDLIQVKMSARKESLAGAQILYDGWTSLSEKEKREVIEAVVDEIVIDESEVSITLAHLSPAQGELTLGQRNRKDS